MIMSHYQDFRLDPDAEFPLERLHSAMMMKLHKALHDFGNGDIGVSFPEEIKGSLGVLIRLHGSQDALQAFADTKWFKRMISFCDATEILSVPEMHEWRVVRRAQPKLTAARLRRMLKRNPNNAEAIKTMALNQKLWKVNANCIHMDSISSEQSFDLFIMQVPVAGPSTAVFGNYGLSKAGSSVPWF